MSQIKIDYNQFKEEIVTLLQKQEFMYMATTDGDKVSNRAIRVITDDLIIWIMTSTNSRKFKQILVNPHVAFASANMQIDGEVVRKHQVLDEANDRFHEVYKERYPKAYDLNSKVYFKYSDMVVLEIFPTRFTLFKTKGPIDETFYEILDLEKKEAYRVMALDTQSAPIYHR